MKTRSHNALAKRCPTERPSA